MIPFLNFCNCTCYSSTTIIIIVKSFWLDQSTLTSSTDWPSFHDCFNQLKESSKYFSGVLKTNVAKNMDERVSKVKCYMYHGNSVFYDMATINPLFSYFTSLYRLEVMFQCCNYLFYIFIHTYFHC